MKIYVLILSIACLVPTDKIECKVDDHRVYVQCLNTEPIKNIFIKHGLKVYWSTKKWKNDKVYIVAAEWKNQNKTYEQARALFFELAKRKDVLRIY